MTKCRTPSANGFALPRHEKELRALFVLRSHRFHCSSMGLATFEGAESKQNDLPDLTEPIDESLVGEVTPDRSKIYDKHGTYTGQLHIVICVYFISVL